MTWTLKADMLLGVNEPARSIDINAIYDNVEAMCNGDANAPKVTEGALETTLADKINSFAGTPTAGAVYLQKYGGKTSTTIGQAKYLVSDSLFAPTVGESPVVATTALKSGQVLYKIDLSGTGIVSGTVSIYKNGALYDSSTFANDTLPQTFYKQTAITKGDVLTVAFEHTGGDPVETTCSIMTSNDIDFVVA